MSEGAPEYLTITALTQYIKRKFDVDPYLGRVMVTGEISNFRSRPGNQYFSLKDEKAKINAMMFASDFAKVAFVPEEGMKVEAVGRVTVYPPNGNYQFYVEEMQPAGVGALYIRFEQLKKKLAAEGLFDRTKRPLPAFPRRIGVITSQSGAVIRDILTTAARRDPLAQIVLFPAQVQGDAAAGSIVHQLQRAFIHPRLDVLIIGRGGGSIEDLWPFNEESVARAIIESPIPIISSVGHETDTTIADLVADVRAATPTAAAELATPNVADLLLRIRQSANTLQSVMQHALTNWRNQMQNLVNAPVLHQPERLYALPTQRLDTLRTRLINTTQSRIQRTRQQVNTLQTGLWRHNPQNRLDLAQQQLADNQRRLTNVAHHGLQQQRQQLANAMHALDLLSPLRVLDRGYAYVTLPDGTVVRQVARLAAAQPVTIHLADGTATAQVLKTEKKEGAAHGHKEETDF
ncbi:exodeoxyribonuclease VII large subunit [Schleiferilactobacillus perolens]|jgi:exodeoxyribonuclease VII large subunit|uniref:Exodeoxyribonuclease 7 large subunit n=1 Tax=Schleiferilactobacillus perolens DSM 12744 TaxID=1423792 RepID=A0A0R1N5R7_9LACO|nr:exodeoxyribonuclease VII large subunit [Schleiferilactobacillus perolens]KRL12930.1 exodeoxyribonuclease 7 large subunit [Schleiferilactobacillus perolens DSM 12744]MCI1892080.1 exodeoxyribonuclease VII large subunit [Schleiferilactobacillus harbinensis]MCI1911786.1 exodeoxyribonuclease VII large subunit [Schleiferilactobacillus harbinensis]MCI2172482.1 exodeoxyribonuclease VII large subunit [Schleiferilactobacillus perolens]